MEGGSPSFVKKQPIGIWSYTNFLSIGSMGPVYLATFTVVVFYGKLVGKYTRSHGSYWVIQEARSIFAGIPVLLSRPA